MLEGQDDVSWPQWSALAEAAEAAGLEALLTSDHVLPVRRPGTAHSFDVWTTLAALAGRTERLRLGTLVSPLSLRAPAALAKTVATVDQISGGRVELGVGAGWYAAEHAAYGLPFPPLTERLEGLERGLAEIVRRWSDGASTPPPLQRPHPPIVVGGLARPRTVRLAVRYAAEYNTFYASVAEAHERRTRLDAAARAAGRAPLRFSLMTACVAGRCRAEVERRRRAHDRVAKGDDPPPLQGTVEQLAAALRSYGEAGVERVVLQQLVHEDVEMVAVLGEVAAAIAA
jgi:alkanesulfonate monooxygenase SsuD/methylene tetrahydromethanopterin reductase-like flavin-dependent oxidoreductase (luciferase family)